MASITAAAQTKSTWVSATVIRCGCGDPASHPDAVCPHPKRPEHRGLISFRHHNPLIHRIVNLWISLKGLFWMATNTQRKTE